MLMDKQYRIGCARPEGHDAVPDSLPREAQNPYPFDAILPDSGDATFRVAVEGLCDDGDFFADARDRYSIVLL